MHIYIQYVYIYICMHIYVQSPTYASTYIQIYIRTLAHMNVRACTL